MDLLLREAISSDFSNCDYRLFDTGSRTAALLRVPTHWHDVLEIVHSGAGGTLFSEGERVPYSPGDFLLIPCRALHGYSETLRGRYRVCFIDIENLTSHRNTRLDEVLRHLLRGETALPLVVSSAHPVFPVLSERFAQLERMRAGDMFRQRACVLELLGELTPFFRAAKPLSSQRRLIQSAVEYLETHSAEALTVDDLCRKFALSKSYFITLFRRFCDTTPIEYLIACRLRRACELLHTDRSVHEIASSCGFRQPSYFNRQFRAAFGVTPLQYRKYLRGGSNPA